jgi:hypothetical protein
MRRTEKIQAVATEEEKRALDALAAREGLKASEWLREHVRSEARRVGLWPIERMEEGMLAARQAS